MVLESENEKFSDKTIKKILFVFLTAGFVAMLNETSLNIAFPTIMLEYSISAATVQWLTTIFVFVSGIIFIISAYLIERFLTRRLYMTSMILLLIGTIINFFSINFTMLMVGRIIQAIGTGIIVPLIFNSVLILSPPEKRGFTMGLVSLVIFAAPMVSPVLMGFIMGISNWHMFFIVSLILFIFITIIGFFFLKNINKVQYSKLDIPSIILIIIGFGGLLYAFSGLGEGINIRFIISIIIGLIGIILFVKRQLHINSPILNLHVFKYSFFRIGLIINMVNIMLVFAIIILLPMYLETALGYSSLMASLVMLPGSVLNCIFPLISGHIYDKRGPKLVISSGLFLLSIGTILLSQLSLTTTVITIAIINAIFYTGSALAVSSNQTNTLGSLPIKYYASGSAIMTSLQQMGGAIGSSLFVSFMTFGQTNYLQKILNPTALQQVQSLVSGVNFSFMIGAILAILTFILSLLLKNKNNISED